MFHLCVCFDLLHFVSLSTIYAVERYVVATVTHTLQGNKTNWQTGPNESVLHFEVVFIVY